MAWEAVNKKNWEQVRFVQNRVATEEDVEIGSAAFYIPSGSEPYQIDLPKLAKLYDEEDKKEYEVIVIQAEVMGEDIYIGYRYLHSGNGVCLLSEIEFLV